MQLKEILQSGDFRYAYRRFGAPDAPAVVLLMGLGMSMDAWPEALVSGLLAEGFQVITPDNRDSGASSRCESWHVTRRDVLGAIAKALLRRPVQGEYGLEDMALDVERLALPEPFRMSDVEVAIEGHVLDTAEIVGRYTLNPALAG